MSTSNSTGEVVDTKNPEGQDYFNVALDDRSRKENWYIGNGDIEDFVSDGLSKGDQVRLTVNKNKGQVTDIEVVGSGSKQNSSGEGEVSDKDAQRSGKGAATDNLTKDQRINRKVAFKEACETIREKSSSDIGNGQHIQEVSKLANGYLRILEDMGGEQ